MTKIKYFLAVLAASPFLAFAGDTDKVKNLDDFLVKLQKWLNTASILLISLTVLAIMWGLFNWIRGGATANKDQKDKGQQIIIWGVISLAVMVGIWGLVSIVTGTFGIGNEGPQTVKLPSLTTQ